MGVHSGKFGVVDGVNTVRNWTIADVMNLKKFIASNTKGGAGRRNGVREWSGSYSRYGGKPINMPGESFSFAGYTSPDDDVSGNGETYSGTAFVDSVAITWDWRNGELLSEVTNFSGHLALSHALATKSDATTPDPEETIGTKIEYGDDVAVTPTEWPNIATAVLTLTAENQSYANSSTVISGVAWTGRKAGNIDWSLAVTVDDNDRSGAGVLDLGDVKQLRLWIDATDYWELFWARVKDYSGITVDTESGAIIGATVNCEMNGWKSGTGEGRIQLPGEVTQWWGA